MNEHILINYGLIRRFHNNKQSIVDTLLPFVEYGISQIVVQQKDHYDRSALRDLIFESTGMKINETMLGNLLKKLEKQNIIEIYQNRQHFRVINHSKLDASNYLSLVDGFQRKIKKLILSYKNFSNDLRDEQTITNFFFDFIRIKNNKVDDAHAQFDNDKIVEYIEHLNKYEDELYNVYRDINFGYTLLSLLEKEKQLDKVKFKNVVLYLDSNFILRLLDLQEECFSKETKELFQLLQTGGIELRVFDETIDEVIGVIEDNKNEYIRENSIKNLNGNIEGVLGAFIRRKLSISDIEDMIEHIEDKIYSFGIKRDSIEKYHVNINETMVKSLYDKKYEGQDDKNSDYYYKKCEDYVKITSIISLLRKQQNVKANCFANSKYLFLTCDWKLYRYSLQEKHTPFSEIITQELLVDNLMLIFPEQYESLSAELAIALFHSSKYIKLEDLKDLYKEINIIKETDPNAALYLVKATKNTEQFNLMKEVLKETEENERLIKLQEFAEKCFRDDKKQKQQLAKETERIIKETKKQAYTDGFESGKEAGFNDGKVAGEKEGILTGEATGIHKGRTEAYLKVAQYRYKVKSRILLSIAITILLSMIIFCGLLTFDIINVECFNWSQTKTTILSWCITVIVGLIAWLTKTYWMTSVDKEYKKIESQFENQNTFINII